MASSALSSTKNPPRKLARTNVIDIYSNESSPIQQNNPIPITLNTTLTLSITPSMISQTPLTEPIEISHLASRALYGNPPREDPHPRGKVFDRTRVEVRLGQVKTYVLPLCQSFPDKAEIMVTQDLANPEFTPKLFDPHRSLIVSIFAQSVAPYVGPATISPFQTNSITIKPLNLLSDMTNEREMAPPLGFSTLTPIPGPNASELPHITTFTFTVKSPENMQLAYRASTSANLNPLISPAFTEANYEVLKSLLRERIKQMRNEDFHTELEYFSEEYDKEKEMEPRLVRQGNYLSLMHGASEGSKTERKGGRVQRRSKQGWKQGRKELRRWKAFRMKSRG
ncbi:hypothetical protein Tco_0412765 [Tanacetum coccineum]